MCLLKGRLEQKSKTSAYLVCTTRLHSFELRNNMVPYDMLPYDMWCKQPNLCVCVFRLYHIDDVPSGAGGDAIDFNKAYAVSLVTQWCFNWSYNYPYQFVK